jgi:hypothetical protein
MARAVAVSLFVICSVLGVLQHCQCSHQPEEKPEAAVNTFKDTAVTRKHRATRKVGLMLQLPRVEGRASMQLEQLQRLVVSPWHNHPAKPRQKSLY